MEYLFYSVCAICVTIIIVSMIQYGIFDKPDNEKETTQ